MASTEPKVEITLKMDLFMKWLLLLSILTTINFNVSAHSELIEDDMDICGSIRVGNLEGVTKALIKKHNTMLESAFLKIRCDNTDLLGMVINAPTDRYSISRNLEKFFKKTIKKPELFSQAILHTIDAKNILRRIELTLRTVRGSEELRDSDIEKRLVMMQKKYIKHLQQYSIAGSAEVVNKHLKFIKAN